MSKSRYRQRLQKDLDRWITGGLVAAENRDAILSDIADAPRGWSASGALAILGAVLMALAAISFVAANWTHLGNLVRLILVFGTLWACFLSSGWAFGRQQPALGHALALLGAALFGVAIVLVAQIFNMSSWRYTVLSIWAVGAIGTALVIPSRPVLILAALLGSSWVWAETFNPYAPGILWNYLPLWAVTVIAASRMRSLVTANLLAIGINVWIIFLLWDYAQDGRLSELQSSSVLILACGASAMLFAAFRDREWFGFGALANWATTLALFSGFIAQFPLDRFEARLGRNEEAIDGWLEIAGVSGPDYWLLAGAFMAILAGALAWRFMTRPATRTLTIPTLAAALAALLLPSLAGWLGGESILVLRVIVGVIVFALAIALILYGSREGRRYTGGVGIALFIAQTLYVYGETFGDLLDTSLFFLIGGLLLFGLSIAVIRLQKRITADAGAPS
ncbi:DUF2157 domain-containing protein [Hyphobacterium sp. HN65]|uniref:DUF2157 domain-containing protein n=1 Tax=Hyphobacterium lacteum TaxID=3116575 RepID=A0ABU7LTJ6_9PROT|nr:DUF2157 domain-containing protein [Hyphobacterium sp. HN65]MEE2527245.1 DUF2157 domain-containing protein [Hyphobacterium sp. HN65]